jgi:hypothetical protein
MIRKTFLFKEIGTDLFAAKQELKKVVNELSDDESRIVLKFAEWLREQKEELTEAELKILRKGEQQVRNGDFVWWRDVKLTDIQNRLIKRISEILQ